MENKHLKGLEQDLNRGIDYNKKHGGVSDALRRMKERPRLHPTSFFTGTMGWTDESWNRVFGKKNVQRKKIRHTISEQKKGNKLPSKTPER